MKYGYARVSTDGQSVAAQVDQLTQAGAEEIFKEKVSGAVTHRQHFAPSATLGPTPPPRTAA